MLDTHTISYLLACTENARNTKPGSRQQMAGVIKSVCPSLDQLWTSAGEEHPHSSLQCPVITYFSDTDYSKCLAFSQNNPNLALCSIKKTWLPLHQDQCLTHSLSNSGWERVEVCVLCAPETHSASYWPNWPQACVLCSRSDNQPAWWNCGAQDK